MQGTCMYSAQAPGPIPPMPHSRSHISWKGREGRQKSREGRTYCLITTTLILPTF